MTTRILIALAAALALGAGAAVVGAQEAPPTVTVTMSARQITLQGAGALQGGPTRFALRAADRREHSFTLGTLKSGVTRAPCAGRAAQRRFCAW